MVSSVDGGGGGGGGGGGMGGRYGLLRFSVNFTDTNM